MALPAFLRFLTTQINKSEALAEDTDAVVKAFIRAERQRLSKSAHSGIGGAAEKRNRKRFASKRANDLAALLLGRARRRRLTKDALTATFRPSPILDALVPSRKQDWVPVLSRSRNETASVELKNFSFLDNPAGTLSALKNLAQVSCRYVDAKVHFADEHCLDIGAYLVLSEVWRSLFPSFTGGNMQPSVQKVLEAVGLREVMRMRLGGVDDLDDIWAFPIKKRVPFGSLHSNRIVFEAQRDQITAEQLCDAIDTWLGVPKPPHELTTEGRAWIATIILELLNNAQRHSNPETSDGNWSIAAFMVRRATDGVETFNCHLGILSVGASINESLRTCEPTTRAELNRFVALQSGSNRSDATLRTLYALQDGVTRDPKAAAKRRGGVGLQDVIELVNTLGGTSSSGPSPRLTILSGRTCISVGEPYMVGRRMAGSTSPRVLWFNARNSASDAPDPLHVFDLDDHFAGTIVSVSFGLDGAYLRQKFDEKN